VESTAKVELTPPLLSLLPTKALIDYKGHRDGGPWFHWSARSLRIPATHLLFVITARVFSDAMRGKVSY
jgi:hypothetical protein